MSDYFGALMRASGIARANPAAARTHPGALEPEPAAPTASEPAPSATGHTALAPPVQALHHTSARTAEAAFDPSARAAPPAPGVQAGAAATAEPRPVIASIVPEPLSPALPPAPAAVGVPGKDAPAASAPVQPAQPAQPDAPAPSVLPKASMPLAQDLMRAAMQWVAADPLSGAPAPAPLETPARGAPAALAPPPLAAAPVGDELALRAEEPHGLVLDPVVAVPAAPAVAPAVFRDGHDRVEVTIGEIHLQVTPPATQTVQRAPPAAPLPAAPRSALARRPLRRI